jgi:hypothetical protein
MSRHGGTRHRQHRPAPTASQRPLRVSTVLEPPRTHRTLVQTRPSVADRIRSIWHRLFGRRPDPVAEYRTLRRDTSSTQAVLGWRRRSTGIAPCGATITGGCTRPSLNGKVHCHKHAPQHIRRLKNRTHRKTVRAQKQRTR